MINYHDRIPKQRLSNGIELQLLGHVNGMNAVHWNLPNGAVIERHHHPQEQFGLVIKGGFRVELGDETFTIGAGDSYWIPSDVPHRFTAIGETEAVDVFSPIRDVEQNYR